MNAHISSREHRMRRYLNRFYKGDVTAKVVDPNTRGTLKWAERLNCFSERTITALVTKRREMKVEHLEEVLYVLLPP